LGENDERDKIQSFCRRTQVMPKDLIRYLVSVFILVLMVFNDVITWDTVVICTIIGGYWFDKKEL